jgi:RNA polymerase sigma-70 factor (ECF subfamily)
MLWVIIVDLREIYEKFFSRIYNFIFYKVLHKEVTEDLTSIVFLKVTEKLHTYDPAKADYSAWIFAIASNTVNDYFRSKAVPVSLDEITAALPSDIDYEGQSQLIKKEERRELYKAISTLDSRTREIIAKKYFEEKPIREIAADMDMNESTVSTIHVRGLKKIKKAMKSFEL